MRATCSSSDETASPMGWGSAQTCKPLQAVQEPNRQEAQAGDWETSPRVRLPGKAAQKLVASNIWFCSIQWTRVTCYLPLSRIAPWTHGSAHEKALTHDLESWQFSPRGRSAIFKDAQTASIPLFRKESPADLPWRIPTSGSQDSR